MVASCVFMVLAAGAARGVSQAGARPAIGTAPTLTDLSCERAPRANSHSNTSEFNKPTVYCCVPNSPRRSSLYLAMSQSIIERPRFRRYHRFILHLA